MNRFFILLQKFKFEMTTKEKIFYEKYFENQAGRNSFEISEQFESEKYCFQKEILPLIPKDKNIKILDLGCGIGSLLKVLKEAGYQNLTGIDISKQQVEMAHQMGISEVKEANIIDYLKSKTTHFDLILGMDIIEHFPKKDLLDLLLLIKKALKKNGSVIFRTPNADAPFSSTFLYGDFTHENQLNFHSANQLMNSCGFSNIRVLDSFVYTPNPLKEILRKIIWFFLKIHFKLTLFASGRSAQNVLFTPNLIISAQIN